MATKRSRKPAATGKKFTLSPLKLYVFGVLAFLASSIFEKLRIDIANYTFAVIGLALFVFAFKKQFWK